MRLRALILVLCAAVLLLCGCSAEDAAPSAEPVSADEAMQEEISRLIDTYLHALSVHDHGEMMSCTDDGFLYNSNETAFVNESRSISSYGDVITDFGSLSRLDDDYLISVSYVLGYDDPDDEEGIYTEKRVNEIFYLKNTDGGLRICSVSSLTVG